MPAFYCIWALLLLVAAPAWAQQAPATRATGYSIFLEGSPIGHEDVTSGVEGHAVRCRNEAGAPNLGLGLVVLHLGLLGVQAEPGNLLAFLELLDNKITFFKLIVLKIAGQWLFNTIMFTKDVGVARVFSGN